MFCRICDLDCHQLERDSAVVRCAIYYAGFLIHVAIVAVLLLYTHVGILAFIAGIFLWTVLEYVFHRFLFHACFPKLHRAHHICPKSLPLIPDWLIAVVTWPLVWMVAPSGVLAGAIVGFMWYSVLHRAIHYESPRFIADRVSTLKTRHLLHHFRSGNYGVTSQLWDLLLQTRC